MMIDLSPLAGAESGESNEPGEGFLPATPCNFGIRVKPLPDGPSRPASKDRHSASTFVSGSGPFGDFGISSIQSGRRTYLD